MSLKVLFIGGTGTISMSITRLLKEQGAELYLFNRGSRNSSLPEGIKIIEGDMEDEAAVQKALDGMHFDAVANFIVYTPEQAQRDIRLFTGKTRQYFFISSASAYQKPPVSFPITESTPVVNPYWVYSQNKIACEALFMAAHREKGFPVTIVRPSHTYDERSIVIGKGWPELSRMLRGKPVIIPGDGATLWTLTHSRDFAKAFVGLLGNAHVLGQTFHITSDEALTWNQIYTLYAESLGVEPRFVHISTDFLCEVSPEDLRGNLTGDKSNNGVFDNSRIKQAVPGFTASIRFDQGVKACVEHILGDKSLQKEDPAYDAWCDRVIAIRSEAISRLKQM